MQTSSNSGTIKYTFDNREIEIVDSTDTTKKLNFGCTNIPTGTSVVLEAPALNGTILTSTSSQINATALKTTTTDVLVSSSVAPLSGQVLTAVNSTSASWQTPTSGSNPPFNDNSALLKDSADNTKLLIIDISNVPSSTTQSIRTPAMNNNDIIVVEGATQTLNFKTLQNTTANDATNDIAANKLKVASGGAGSAVSIDNAPSGSGLVLTTVSAGSAQWTAPVAPPSYATTHSFKVGAPTGGTYTYVGGESTVTNLSLLLTDVIYNNGSMFNTSTGLFTPDVGAVYIMTLTCRYVGNNINYFGISIAPTPIYSLIANFNNSAAASGGNVSYTTIVYNSTSSTPLRLQVYSTGTNGTTYTIQGASTDIAERLSWQITRIA